MREYLNRFMANVIYGDMGRGIHFSPTRITGKIKFMPDIDDGLGFFNSIKSRIYVNGAGYRNDAEFRFYLKVTTFLLLFRKQNNTICRSTNDSFS